jgi:ribosomal-protein-alanine N-acetyltransferase
MTAQALEKVLAEGSPWLATADFDLRPLEAADAPDLLVHFADPRVVAFMDIDPLSDADDALEIIHWAQSQRAGVRGARLAVRHRATGEFVGTCGFNSLTLQQGRRGEIAYDLGAGWWGRGVMAQILPRLVEIGFEALVLRRLEARVTPGNDRSCAVLERHGFVREGVLRDHGFWKGRYQDVILYARINPGEQG